MNHWQMIAIAYVLTFAVFLLTDKELMDGVKSHKIQLAQVTPGPVRDAGVAGDAAAAARGWRSPTARRRSS